MTVNYIQKITKFGNIQIYIEFNNIEFCKRNNYYYNSKLKKYLHIYIYEYTYKCSILKSNDIHHIDFNPDNNDITNLELMTHSDHVILHSKGNIYWVGKKHTLETLQKMSNTRKGRPLSEEHKQKLRKPLSEEHKQHMCQKRSEQHKQNISKAQAKENHNLWIEPTYDMVQDIKNKIKRKDFMSKYKVSQRIWDKIKNNLNFYELKTNKKEG